MTGLTHTNDKGEAHMVDVSGKDISCRQAVASGRIRMTAEALEALRHNRLKKGDAFAVARVAGIMGAKKCADLIPLCHPLPIDAVKIDFEFEDSTIYCTTTVTSKGRTGVEMEAMTATSVALLTLYDMVKAVDRAMRIESIHLNSKSGGRSGHWQAP